MERKKILIGRMCAVLLMAMAVGNCDCGGTPYKGIAYGQKIVDYSARITEKFDEGVDTWAKMEDAKCTAKHGAKTAEYAGCIKKALDFLRAWNGKVMGKPTGKGILPAIQSAQRATRHALDAAFDYVAKNEDACKKGDAACSKKTEAWKAALKPGLCALKAVVDRAVKIGAYKATQDSYWKLVMGLADALCGK